MSQELNTNQKQLNKSDALKLNLFDAVKKENFPAVETSFESCKDYHDDLGFLEEPDEYGDKVLHHAAETGNKKILQFLIENGADVNTRNILEQTPLHIAALYNNQDAVIYLVSQGADQTAVDINNKIPEELTIENIEQILAIVDSNPKQTLQLLISKARSQSASPPVTPFWSALEKTNTALNNKLPGNNSDNVSEQNIPSDNIKNNSCK